MIRVSNRLVAIALAGTLVSAAEASAQSSVFTYQGQLKQSGSPMNGTADLDFYIYDAPAGGMPIAGPDSHVSVPVTDGMFTVPLDFGPPGTIFDGNVRWLQVNVDGTPLSPRQELTAAPYAQFSALPWETSGNDVFYSGGRVGIGTDTPTADLDVRGTLTLEAGGQAAIFTGTGPSELNRNLLLLNSPQFQSASGLKAGGVLVSDSYFFATPGKNDLIVKGAVGIATPTPLFPLSVEAFGHGIVHSSGSTQVGTYADASAGWIGTRSNHPLKLFTNDSVGQVTLSTAGNLGVGTTTPVRRLHALASDLFVARFESSNSSASVTEFRNSSSNATWEYGVAGSAGALGLPAGSAYFYKQGNGAAAISMAPDNTTQVNGRFKCNILEVLGADVAEKFPSTDEAVEPGTVMEIDPDNAGQLRICREAYSSRVAGVVSGAGDLPAGAVLGNLEGNEDAPAIALSGRVWVRCDARTAAIVPGDLLTTASTSGHAMKAVDRDRSHGAIIGKAMTALAEGGTGLVLVLVNLQ
jgi:hypothetical protein